MIQLMVLLIVIVTSIWVSIDAAKIGARPGIVKGLGNMGPLGWGFACLGIWIIAFPAYLSARSRIIDAVAYGAKAGPLHVMRPGMIQCPACKGPIPKGSIMVGLNSCPHCRKDYEAEDLAASGSDRTLRLRVCSV